MKAIYLITLMTFTFSLANSCSNAPKKSKPKAECLCIEIYDPVCGKDGLTYANACKAGCAKQKFSPGECVGP